MNDHLTLKSLLEYLSYPSRSASCGSKSPVQKSIYSPESSCSSVELSHQSEAIEQSHLLQNSLIHSPVNLKPTGFRLHDFTIVSRGQLVSSTNYGLTQRIHPNGIHQIPVSTTPHKRLKSASLKRKKCFLFTTFELFKTFEYFFLHI